jgi:hypothetical protein
VENENGLLGNSIRFEATRETDGEKVKFGKRNTSKLNSKRRGIQKEGNRETGPEFCKTKRGLMIRFCIS